MGDEKTKTKISEQFSSASVDNSKPAYLQSKFRIGSRKGQINYGHDETVFHPDDIPTEKKKNREDVLEYKKKSHLGEGKTEWNSSVYVQKIICEDKRVRANFEHDRVNMHQYNYRAEVLPDKLPAPPPKDHRFKVHGIPEDEIERRRLAKEENRITMGISKRTEEMQIHPKLEGKLGWNATTVLTHKDKKELFRAQQERSKVNSERAKALLTSYQNPEELAKSMRQKERLLKTQLKPALAEQPNDTARNLLLKAEHSSMMMSLSNQDSFNDNGSIMTYNRLNKNPTQKNKKLWTLWSLGIQPNREAVDVVRYRIMHKRFPWRCCESL